MPSLWSPKDRTSLIISYSQKNFLLPPLDKLTASCNVEWDWSLQGSKWVSYRKLSWHWYNPGITILSTLGKYANVRILLKMLFVKSKPSHTSEAHCQLFAHSLRKVCATNLLLAECGIRQRFKPTNTNKSIALWR